MPNIGKYRNEDIFDFAFWCKTQIISVYVTRLHSHLVDNFKTYLNTDRNSLFHILISIRYICQLLTLSFTIV